MHQLDKTAVNNVTRRENPGTPVPVKIDSQQWDSLQDLVELRKNEIDKEDGLVDGSVIMTELGISKRRLQNMVSDGTISKDMYVVLPNGMKKYRWKKIMRLE